MRSIWIMTLVTTGYDVAYGLENHPEHLPGRVEIVSSNPVGRRNIEFVLVRIHK